MSVLAGLQIDGGAKVSVQIVSCGCPQNQVVQFVGSEVESRSVTFVEQCVNLGGGAVFLCVSTASSGQHVCLGGRVNLGLASVWPVRCQTNLTGECLIHQVK